VDLSRGGRGIHCPNAVIKAIALHNHDKFFRSGSERALTDETGKIILDIASRCYYLYNTFCTHRRTYYFNLSNLEATRRAKAASPRYIQYVNTVR
jgi:hypothetical protein